MPHQSQGQMQMSVTETPIVSPDSVRQKVQAILRAAQAQGWTDDQLEAASGVPKRAIKSYRVEGKQPCLANALSLAVVLGKPAINLMLSLIGYSGTPLDEADEAHPGTIVAECMSAVSVLAKAAADGRFDHVEMPDCQQAADLLIATVLPISSAGQAQ